MLDMAENDLTEKMLLKQMQSPETSLISNNIPELPKYDSSLWAVSQTAVSDNWYRMLHKAGWVMQGMSIESMISCLGAIASSKNERTRPERLDTVSSYGEGNWCYEFTHRGVELTKIAKNLENSGDIKKASKNYLDALICFVNASYPHLNGDRKADQAQALAVKTYREILRLDDVKFKELSVVEHNSKKTIKSWLHLPRSNKPAPLVVVAGGLESVFEDFYFLYKYCIQPMGYAMLIMDNPGTGQNQSFDLDYDCSLLHRTTLDAIAETMPEIDPGRISAIGFRFGGNIVTRMAYMRAKFLKSAICIAPAINSIFTQRDKLDMLPPMLKAVIANRVGKDTRDWEHVVSSVKQFSLKVQGLLGSKTTTKINVIGYADDVICDKADLELLGASGTKGKIMVIKRNQKLDLSKNFYSTLQELLREDLG